MAREDNIVATFIANIQTEFATGQATEHSYRPALKQLFDNVVEGVTAQNEPKREACGAPDFVFRRNKIEIGHCEAKDVPVDITKLAGPNLDQKRRYLKGLPNLIYTNGLDFEFYKEGELIRQISIATLSDKTITPNPSLYGELTAQLASFVHERPATIGTAKRLAEIMAGKAILIKDIIGRALVQDLKRGHITDLVGQYEGFKAHLIHDTTVADFADVYAETIAYGLFAARLHDTSLNTFSRAEALELLPRSNPFLRSLFGYIAGLQQDEGIAWVIDELCEMFRAADLHAILKDFGKFTGRNDPFLHFYETFLGEYNPAKKKARGVWYTPEPVVNFIVRAVDDVLKTEFGLADGLADTSKVTVDWDTGQTDNKGKPVTIKKEVHRVQVLDPATGTGTFLAEVIKLVAGRVKGIAPGQWSGYVEQDLIPRLHGFELLMASYAMCHMKLDMMLTELGYKPSGTPPRLGVYLTNSLEEGEVVSQNLFAQWIANEAKGANTIKRDQPIMCVIGNPPYSNSSANMGSWIRSQIEPYKKDLNETRIHLDDDYVKFIRLSELFMSRMESGVVAMITNNSFLDGASHKTMRRHLMKTYSAIYVLNLFGDARNDVGRSLRCNDENIFDIQQGVCITVMIKNNKESDDLAKTYYASWPGSRVEKYDLLWSENISEKEFEILMPREPDLRLTNADYSNSDSYESGFRLNEFFETFSSGIQSKRDGVCIADSPAEMAAALAVFRDNSVESIRTEFALGEDGRDWTIAAAKAEVVRADGQIVPINYRVFDRRWTYYTGRSRHFLGYPRHEVMQHIVGHENLLLVVNRQTARDDFSFVSVTNVVTCHGTHYLGNRGQDYACPLYLYPPDGTLDPTIRVNFNPKLYADIREAAGLTGLLVAPDGTDGFRKATGEDRPDEVKVFDYIYGVLHCPAYRETYREFLKIDFPRVPYPPSPDIFRRISEQGEALRRLHLMEDAAIGETPFVFLGEEGDSVVDKPRLEDGKVWINATQAFAGVSQTAWDFHIGGYQPAQKWLKDRKGRQLSWDGIRHYQKIIKILGETDRIMREIDLPLDVADDEEMAA